MVKLSLSPSDAARIFFVALACLIIGVAGSAVLIAIARHGTAVVAETEYYRGAWDACLYFAYRATGQPDPALCKPVLNYVVANDWYNTLRGEMGFEMPTPGVPRRAPASGSEELAP